MLGIKTTMVSSWNIICGTIRTNTQYTENYTQNCYKLLIHKSKANKQGINSKLTESRER